MLHLALYQPDIPQNVGGMIRLAACMGAKLHIIEPCGFVWDERRVRQVAMDYAELADVQRQASWEKFVQSLPAKSPDLADGKGGRLVLLTTRAEVSYLDFQFRPDDILLLGRESAGVPDYVSDAADARITIPMRPGARSLNVVTAAAMVLGEMTRQSGKTWRRNDKT